MEAKRLKLRATVLGMMMSEIKEEINSSSDSFSESEQPASYSPHIESTLTFSNRMESVNVKSEPQWEDKNSASDVDSAGEKTSDSVTKNEEENITDTVPPLPLIHMEMDTELPLTPIHIEKKNSQGCDNVEKLCECVICGNHLRNKRNLLLHMQQHSGEKHKCTQCEKEYSTLQSLKHHRRKVHTGANECSYCGNNFKGDADLQAHIGLHTGEQESLCDKEEVDSSSDSFLESEQPVSYLPHSEPAVTFPNLMGSVNDKLKPHWESNNSAIEVAKPCECLHCGKELRNKRNLLLHMKQHSGEKHKCPECEKEYSTLQSLKHHRKVHTGANECSYCGKNFKGATDLEAHMGLHTGERNFVCEKCAKDFTSLSGLNAHLPIHFEEQWVACNTCGKKFARVGDLKVHSRIHSGEKPYECNTCGLKFGHLSNLTSHKRIHTGEKRFSCVICDRRFLWMSRLHQHMKMHTGQKTYGYSCEICDKRFSQSGDLKRHIRIHTGEKPYVCDTCEAKFSQLAHLKAHRNTHIRQLAVQSAQQA